MRQFSLRRAMEDDSGSKPQSGEPQIEMKGPLSDVLTKALNVAYAKEPVGDGNVANESQAQEVTIMQQILSQINSQQPESGDSDYTVYGVAEADIDPQVYMEVGHELTENETPEHVIVVVDGTDRGVNGPESVPTEKAVDVALEALVTKLGGKFIRYKK